MSVWCLYECTDFCSTPTQNVADIKKLKSSGICTIKVCSVLKYSRLQQMCLCDACVHLPCAKGVQMTTKKRLGNIKGLSEAKVDKIKVTHG